jgi:hypothetical protein
VQADGPQRQRGVHRRVDGPGAGDAGRADQLPLRRCHAVHDALSDQRGVRDHLGRELPHRDQLPEAPPGTVGSAAPRHRWRGPRRSQLLAGGLPQSEKCCGCGADPGGRSRSDQFRLQRRAAGVDLLSPAAVPPQHSYHGRPGTVRGSIPECGQREWRSVGAVSEPLRNGFRKHACGLVEPGGASPVVGVAGYWRAVLQQPVRSRGTGRPPWAARASTCSCS